MFNWMHNEYNRAMTRLQRTRQLGLNYIVMPWRQPTKLHPWYHIIWQTSQKWRTMNSACHVSQKHISCQITTHQSPPLTTYQWASRSMSLAIHWSQVNCWRKIPTVTLLNQKLFQLTHLLVEFDKPPIQRSLKTNKCRAYTGSVW